MTKFVLELKPAQTRTTKRYKTRNLYLRKLSFKLLKLHYILKIIKCLFWKSLYKNLNPLTLCSRYRQNQKTYRAELSYVRGHSNTT